MTRPTTYPLGPHQLALLPLLSGELATLSELGGLLERRAGLRLSRVRLERALSSLIVRGYVRRGCTLRGARGLTQHLGERWQGFAITRSGEVAQDRAWAELTQSAATGRVEPEAISQNLTSNTCVRSSVTALLASQRAHMCWGG